MSVASLRSGVVSRMEIITGVERRRRWSLEEKLRIVAEIEQPGAGIAEIARRYEVSRGLLWNWRSQVRRGLLRPEPPPVFLPVQAINEPANGHDAKRCVRRQSRDHAT
jgi:transposase